MKIEQLIRKHLLQVKPYSSARDEFKGHEGIFLDANENALGSVGSANLYNRYPDPHQYELKEKLAALKNIDSKQIFIGNGSDEPIDLLIRLLCEPQQDNIIICPPTYGMYGVSAAINNVAIQQVLLTAETFQIQPDKILAQVNEHTKIIFICSPNNPTGNIIEPALIEQLLTNFNGIVVIDEAYIDFTHHSSWIEQLNKYDNVVVLQTFSKAWGLANLRIGVLYASALLVHYLDIIKPPYNVNGYSQQVAIAALQNAAKQKEYVTQILQQRNYLQQALSTMNSIEKIYESDANFLLIKVADANNWYQQLTTKNIVVRNRSNQPLCANTLRITVGTSEENEKLVGALMSLSI